MFKTKKGLSLIIGYILLVSISIAMSIIVYQWIRNYVPTDEIKCPEGTSLFIKSINYDCANSILNITIKNNGRFDIDGFYIRATNISNQQMPTTDLSSKIITGGERYQGAVKFSKTDNFLSPTGNNEKMISFDVGEYNRIYKIEIVPTRIQIEDDKTLIVSCGDSRIQETINCN